MSLYPSFMSERRVKMSTSVFRVCLHMHLLFINNLVFMCFTVRLQSGDYYIAEFIPFCFTSFAKQVALTRSNINRSKHLIADGILRSNGQGMAKTKSKLRLCAEFCIAVNVYNARRQCRVSS